MAEAAGQPAPGSKRGAKSPDAFRTISEVAEELDVPQHVLRFWESKFSQVRPLKRGGGRRYYRPEDVELLRRIRALLYTEGYAIKGVQKVLRENGRKGVLSGDHAVGREESDEAASPGHREVLRGLLGELTDLKAILEKRQP